MHADVPGLEALRAAIARDPAPVRALRPARPLGVALAGFAAAGLLVLWWAFGLRDDHHALGVPWLWGLSAVELLLAAALLGLALRDTIPGRRPSLALLGAAAAAVAGLHLATSWATFQRSPVAAPAGHEARLWLACFCMELALALPVAFAVAALARRGLVTWPGRVGVVGGLGAGVAGDALWRLHCPYSDLAHVLAAHSGAILAASALGLAVAWSWDRARLRAWRRARPR